MPAFTIGVALVIMAIAGAIFSGAILWIATYGCAVVMGILIGFLVTNHRAP